MSVCPNNNSVSLAFSDYIFDNRTDDGSPFSPNIWAKKPMFNIIIIMSNGLTKTWVETCNGENSVSN